MSWYQTVKDVMGPNSHRPPLQWEWNSESFCLFLSALHESVGLASHASQRHDLIKRRQHERLFRNNPGSRQNFWIFDGGFDLEGVLINAMVAFHHMHRIGME